MTDGGFVCLKCGQCCRGRGGIWLDDEGRAKAASQFGLAIGEFTERFLEFQAGLWSIRVSDQGRCLMWAGAGCRIHLAKPVMCQAWPFFYGPLNGEGAFRAAQDACVGLKDWDWERLKAAAPFRPPKSFRQFLKPDSGKIESTG